MTIQNNPTKAEWSQLIKRPYTNNLTVKQTVSEVLQKVQQNGDQALFEYAMQFDNVELSSLTVTDFEFAEAELLVNTELRSAILLAKENIEKFHTNQAEKVNVIETQKGVNCWRKNVAIEKIGLYIPAGSAPLFSTILMLGIPAKLAGCKEIILCTPSDTEGKVNPVILYTAALLGITTIYKTGGAQAIAAMAYGTETIPQVYKIFGPGNQYVTAAKELVQQTGTAIDMPAGPSELLVIADETSIPEFVASDLLSQAEHGADSQVILVSQNPETIANTLAQLTKQLEVLPRKEIAQAAIQNSRIIQLENLDACIKFSNVYAPEHLIIATKDAGNLAENVTNAGSVFIGNYSPESAGDYASGTNHTLPTNGYARSYSGVSLDSFLKKITFQELSATGIQTIGPAIEIMAEAEQLQAHKNAVTVRLNSLKK